MLKRAHSRRTRRLALPPRAPRAPPARPARLALRPRVPPPHAAKEGHRDRAALGVPLETAKGPNVSRETFVRLLILARIASASPSSGLCLAPAAAVVVSQPAAASVQPTARPMAKRRRIRKSLRLSSESRKGPLPITPGQNDPVSSIMRRCRTGTPARFRIRYLFAIARPAGGTKGRQAGSAVPCEDDIACS